MTRKEQYEQLLPQIAALIKGEKNLVGILANVSAALHDTFPERFFWVGFYLRQDERHLRLGPFQAPSPAMPSHTERVSAARHGKKGERSSSRT